MEGAIDHRAWRQRFVALLAAGMLGGCMSEARLNERFAERKVAVYLAVQDDPSLRPLLTTLHYSVPAIYSAAWAGAGVPIAEGGYFLTASHCIGESTIAVHLPGREGKPGATWFATPVWVGDLSLGQPDVAVIHVAGLDVAPIPWADLNEIAAGDVVIAAGTGMDRTTMALTMNRFSLGSIASPTPTRETSWGAVTELIVDAPIVPGDSGGPVVTRSGLLIGHLIEATFNPLTGEVESGTVARPDPAWIASIVAADRAR